MTIPIEQGAEGPEVVGVQVALTALGVFSGEASGTFDQATSDAVTQFQAGVGLEATGVVDPDTLSALGGQPFHPEERTQLPMDEFPSFARVVNSGGDVDAYLGSLGIDPSDLSDDNGNV
ncbi:peptidoglycan-binding domain-containing protein [Streptomyces sp. ID05-47C]|uniref:peptidoglycan-binding domain-containing protein n=1 Tax=Streptomyces sp. ID05-47C TaxID=3028665 RepID=UPI0029AE82A9|nr:peptidoglycan-binding domain-containing protein [Streptomyces sp. ID05-47C]MDX3573757.1 peptidoglycan-binding domain-containing protein [Streptomyces sp. ID05-47C]